jgi:hypothetical protein
MSAAMKPLRGRVHLLVRVPINWNQLIGKTTLSFKVLERLYFAQLGEKRSRAIGVGVFVCLVRIFQANETCARVGVDR